LEASGSGADDNRDEVVMGSAVTPRSETTLFRPGAGSVRPWKRRSRQALGSAPAAEVAPELTVEQRVGRAAWRGVLIGLVAMAALGTGLGLATGYDMIESLGLGAFAAIWGGPGFGGMLGAILAYVRAEQREGAHSVLAIEQQSKPRRVARYRPPRGWEQSLAERAMR
jgi:hypothetical protein